MNHLRNVLQGFSSIFAGFQPRTYAHSNGFRDDIDNMRNDVKTLGQDFTKSANTVYGKATPSASERR